MQELDKQLNLNENQIEEISNDKIQEKPRSMFWGIFASELTIILGIIMLCSESNDFKSLGIFSILVGIYLVISLWAANVLLNKGRKDGFGMGFALGFLGIFGLIIAYFTSNENIKNNTVETKTNNGLCLSGFILGLISIFIGASVGILPILTIIFSSVGLGNYKEGINKNKWMGILGLILGILYTLSYLDNYGYFNSYK